MMDVGPILGFILIYVFAASRDFLGLKPWQAGLAAAAFVPYAALTVPLWGRVPGLGSSAGYAPVPVLILVYAWLLRGRAPETARGLASGGGPAGRLAGVPDGGRAALRGVCRWGRIFCGMS